MPIIQIPLGLDGPMVDVSLSVPKTYAPWGGPPGTWRALIDTGSNMTTISPAVVAALQPMRLGAQAVRRPVSGVKWCDTYDVRLRFGRVHGRWFHTEALEVQPATTDVDVLIGMDLLLQIDMAWHGPRGLVILSLSVR
jgi:hypothetical protein